MFESMWNMLTKFALAFLLCLPVWGQTVIFVKKDAGPTCAGYSDIGTLGNNNSTSAGVTLTITTSATLEAGNVGVLAIGKDNACTVDTADTSEISTVVDTALNTWTKIREFCNTDGGAANDSATISLWATVASSQLTSGGTITITLSSSTTAKSAVAREFSLGADCEGDSAGGSQTNGTDGAVDPPSMVISGLVNEGHLFVRAMAFESRDNDITPTASYTESANAVADGGSGGASITTLFEFRALTAAGDTSDPSKTTDVSNANVFAALK